MARRIDETPVDRRAGPSVAPIVQGAWGGVRVEEAVRRLLDPGAISVVFQPVIRLAGGSVIGYEALARFDGSLPLRTDEWFDLAWGHNLGADLELACWEAAAEAGPPPGGALLFVNCRAETLLDRRAAAVHAGFGGDVVLELSERVPVDDYASLRATLDRWVVGGARLAIDDTGAGYASLRHVVHLEPDYVKLDRSLIADIDRDRNQRAMVCALVAYADEAGAEVIAEGVERPEELQVLRELGVHLAQGYLLARPDLPWPATVWSPRLAARIGADGGESRLQVALADAVTVREACDALAAHLARGGDVMPSVYLERDGVLRCQAQRGLWQVLDGMPPEAGITGRTFRTGDTVVVPDISQDDAYLEAIPGVRSEACTPIRVDGEVVGAVNIESYEELPPSVVTELVRAAALLGERLRGIGLHTTRGAGSHLPRLAAHLAAVTDDGELRRAVCAAVSELAGMDSALLALGRPAAGNVGARWEVEVHGPLAPTLATLEDGQYDDLARLVQQVASCYTAGDTTGACFQVARSLRGAGARSVVILPLDARNTRAGFVLVAHTAPVRLDPDDVEALELLATHAALCVESARVTGEWRSKAVTDPLTGLANRSAFRGALDAWRADHARASLLLADIDGFKSVNDRLGHLVGDRVLCLVAEAMQAHVRPGDVIYRIGGDEFAVMLHDADEDDIDAVGRRVRDAVGEVLAPYGAALSIGATVLRSDLDIETLIHRADQSLYDAKRRGGGRIRLAS